MQDGPTEMLPLWSPVKLLVSSERSANKSIASVPTWETKLLLERAQNQTKGLSPDQVDEVSKPTQAPDVPLISAKAVIVDFSVDEDTLLLVERQAFEFLTRNASARRATSLVLWRGRRAHLVDVGVEVLGVLAREPHGVCISRILI